MDSISFKIEEIDLGEFNLAEHEFFLERNEESGHEIERQLEAIQNTSAPILLAHDAWMRSFPCMKCGHRFRLKCNLMRHIKTVHEKLRPYPCPECGKFFSRRDNIKAHMNSVHKQLNQFPRARCGKSFAQEDLLKIHINKVHCTEYFNGLTIMRDPDLTTHMNAIQNENLPSLGNRIDPSSLEVSNTMFNCSDQVTGCSHLSHQEFLRSTHENGGQVLVDICVHPPICYPRNSCKKAWRFEECCISYENQKHWKYRHQAQFDWWDSFILSVPTLDFILTFRL